MFAEEILRSKVRSLPVFMENERFERLGNRKVNIYVCAFQCDMDILLAPHPPFWFGQNDARVKRGAIKDTIINLMQF